MTYPQALALLAALPKETLLAIANVSRDDGHTLFDPTAYITAGLTVELASFFTQIHQSNGTLKGTIFHKGGVVQQVEGIYGLTVNEAIANALELKIGTFFGRGFRAAALFFAIQHHCQPTAAPVAA
jgi:hypothetical protein